MNVVVLRPNLRCFYICLEVMNSHENVIINKGKGKVLPRTDHEGPEGEQMYSSTRPSTSALKMGVSGQRHARAALPPGKTRYPLHRRLDRPQGRSGRVRKILPPPGFNPRTVQPVASRYTD